MTMRASIIAADITREGAKLLLGNGGLVYETFFNASLKTCYTFFQNNAKPGRLVNVEFKEINDKLEIKSLDFIKE